MKTPVLQVGKLRLEAADRVLLEDLQFEAYGGQRWCVIGRNAAGKSTLLRALAGLQTPSAGWVQLGSAPSPVRPAYLPQSVGDRFDLTVREFIGLHASGAADPTLLLAQCQALDVAHLVERPITKLSGGERQRVGLAAVAVQNAALWLLDEPVSFQDPAHQGVVGRWLLSQSQAILPRTIIMTAHDMVWVQLYATHLIAIYDDMTVTLGKISEILCADLLEKTFACQWRQVGGVWMVA